MKNKNILKRKTTLIWFVVAVIVSIGSYAAFNTQPTKAKDIVVYKDPNCGCCKAWITHLERNNFNVVAYDERDMRSIKRQLQVPDHLQSCHTASIDGYTIEGHVPADLIERLIEEKSDVLGLAVPGMPMGSPGMEGRHKDAYEILTFDENGKTSVFANR
ncbi:MAG: DUF411 domain-containing protein [Gammaproteobacteria bacterium]|nr:DUF411 domain-containing protein [Gammaproteobacteria bacterium]